jgi:hypothetical protein
MQPFWAPLVAQDPGQFAGVDAGDRDRAFASEVLGQRAGRGAEVGGAHRQVLDHEAGSVDPGRLDVLGLTPVLPMCGYVRVTICGSSSGR